VNNTIALAIKKLNVGIFFTTVALSSGIAQASALYSGDLSLTLVFPSTLEADKFGFTGPVASFKNLNPSNAGNMGLAGDASSVRPTPPPPVPPLQPPSEPA
jgi:hypothetical protein